MSVAGTILSAMSSAGPASPRVVTDARTRVQPGASVEPAVVDRAAAETASAETASAEVTSVEPAAAETASVEPASVETATAETAAAELTSADPEHTEPPAWRGHLSRWTPRLLPPLLYALAAAYYYSRFLAHPTRGVPGGADGVIYTWYFEWVDQAFVHLHNPFVSPALNAPTGVNVMWNTALFAMAVVCIPFTALFGAGPTLGFVAVLAPVASASTAYFVLRRITGRAAGSALAAAIYGFGPFFVGQNGHVHLTIAVFPPLLLLFGYQLFVEQDRSPVRVGIWLGIAAGLQLLISEEVAALAVIVAAVSLAALAALNPRQVAARVRRGATGLAVAGATAIVIAGVPLGYQFFGPLALAHGVLPTRQRLDLAGLVRPGVQQYYASSADIAANKSFPANGVENTGYLGWALIAVVLVTCGAMIIQRQRFAYWWLLTTLATIGLSLGTPVVVNGNEIGPGPWALLRRLPTFDGVVVVRFTLVTTLLVALLLAWGLARLRGRAYVVGLIVVAAALVPLRPYGRYNAILPISTPRFFTTSAVHQIPSGATAFLMPYEPRPQPMARVMVWQIRSHLRFRIVGGYSVFNRHGRMTYASDLPDFAKMLIAVQNTGQRPTAAQLAAGRASVAPSGVHYIVISDEQGHRNQVVRAATDLTGCTPRRSADVTLCEVLR
jgi:hypothetical protein